MDNQSHRWLNSSGSYTVVGAIHDLPAAIEPEEGDCLLQQEAKKLLQEEEAKAASLKERMARVSGQGFKNIAK